MAQEVGHSVEGTAERGVWGRGPSFFLSHSILIHTLRRMLPLSALRAVVSCRTAIISEVRKRGGIGCTLANHPSYKETWHTFRVSVPTADTHSDSGNTGKS